MFIIVKNTGFEVAMNSKWFESNIDTVGINHIISGLCVSMIHVILTIDVHFFPSRLGQKDAVRSVRYGRVCMRITHDYYKDNN